MADPTGAPYDVLTQGASVLNLPGATSLARSIDPRSPVGTSWLVKRVLTMT